MSDLPCPKCTTPMTTLERSGVTLERCTECGGIFLDRGELERIAMAEAPGHDTPTTATAPPATPTTATPTGVPGVTAVPPGGGQALLGELMTCARQYRGGGRR